MPYIKQEDRTKLMIEAPMTAGELNYLITKMCHQYINSKGENYQNYNDIIGALEGAKLEIYRRKISRYEDKKIEENGDV